jgi:hypothetical protein
LAAFALSRQTVIRNNAYPNGPRQPQGQSSGGAGYALRPSALVHVGKVLER